MADTTFSDAIDKLKESFLLAAAQGGNLQDCESLLEFGADVNWKNADGDTPLLAATRRGHTDTMALLLAYGADSNISGADSFTPLHVSTRRGDASSVNILLEANTDPTVRTRDGQTALDIARAKGYENIYARLMERRSGVVRTPASTISSSSSRGTSSGLARPELPAISHVRPGSTGGVCGAGSLVPESRQLRNLGRLVHPESARNDEVVSNSNGSGSAGTDRNGLPSRRQRSDNIQNVDATSDTGLVGLSTSVSVNERRSKAEADMKSTDSNNTGISTSSTRASSSSGGRSRGFIESSSRSAANNKDSYDIGNHNNDNNNNNTNNTTASQQRQSQSDSSKSGAGAVGRSGGSQGSGYSIMGSASTGRSGGSGDETALIALKKILDQEVSSRKVLEGKLMVFKETNKQLLDEFASLSQQLTASQDCYAQLEHELCSLKGEPSALEAATYEECEEIEAKLKASLQRVEAKKTALLRNRMVGNQNEQRMCVICQDSEKSVVLLPCRHMCVCASCSEHAQLTTCPLCRVAIAHKINVFA
mmetsp:Transcript_38111/g.75975  ORF Transcript_38111/g.75975 Transcript_38111/m.75975 type:complete len:536 (-) Transcript_38111:159-1766(-)